LPDAPSSNRSPAEGIGAAANLQDSGTFRWQLGS
jgi:hypothetical protein